YLIKGRESELAKKSIPIAAIVGLVATLLVAFTGDKSAVFVAERQPMKLAAMEGLYEGRTNCPLIAIGILNPAKKSINDGIDPFIFKLEIPNALSLLSFRESDAYVPGIKNIIEGGYLPHNGTTSTESIDSRIESGKMAIAALRDYKVAKADGDTMKADAANLLLKANFNNFGYGYLANAEQAIPPIALTFYSFHLMVILGFYFFFFFILIYWLNHKEKLQNMKWLLWVGVWSVPLAYLTTQFGWIVSEVGRQPWVIQDLLPTYAAVSSVSVKSVQTTFFIFLALFTVLLIAELKIMFSQIRKGV
ncbi:MAG: cytochrome ubiquinol oxidase subunit I, partial [Bacteroidales bacterium]